MRTTLPTATEPSSAGVRTTRRALFRGGLALTGMGVLSHWSRARANHATLESDHVDFFERWIERAAELTASDDPNEDAALHELCAELTRFDRASFPEPFRVAYEENGLKIGPVGGDATLQILQIDLEPGAVIRPHNHVGFCFVSLGLQGGVRARHFEPVGVELDPPEGVSTEKASDVVLREVSSTWLTPGRTSTLTRTRANIHTFQAGDDGARMIDFGIHFSNPGDGPTRFSVLEIDDSPRDQLLRTFDARWVGNIFAK